MWKIEDCEVVNNVVKKEKKMEKIKELKQKRMWQNYIEYLKFFCYLIRAKKGTI